MPAPPNTRRSAEQTAGEARTTYTDLGEGSLSGNLTRAPELRYTPDGRAVATMRLAETERVKDDQTGKWGDGQTSFYDVVVWGDQAERVIDCLDKSDRIAAVGKWQKQEWTADDGTPKSKTVLVARDIGPSLLFRAAWIDGRERSEGGQ